MSKIETITLLYKPELTNKEAKRLAELKQERGLNKLMKVLKIDNILFDNSTDKN